MCLICIDFNRGALRPNEARRALSEMREALPAEHVRELEQKLTAAENQPKPSGTP
jgi:hypothetical protein